MRDPQMYVAPFYTLEVSETSGVGTSVATVQVKSFQDLSLNYEITSDNDESRGVFTIDPRTGALSLLVLREYIRHPHQYRYSLVVSEENPSPHNSISTVDF